MTILVVDDSPTQRARWLYALSGANTAVISEEQPVPSSTNQRYVIRIVTAKNGEHALARLRTLDVSLMITDVEMPGMSGWALAAAALRPATMAVTTRLGPVTSSPPAYTPGREVAPVLGSA